MTHIHMCFVNSLLLGADDLGGGWQFAMRDDVMVSYFSTMYLITLIGDLKMCMSREA